MPFGALSLCQATGLGLELPKTQFGNISFSEDSGLVLPPIVLPSRFFYDLTIPVVEDATFRGGSEFCFDDITPLPTDLNRLGPLSDRKSQNSDFVPVVRSPP